MTDTPELDPGTLRYDAIMAILRYLRDHDNNGFYTQIDDDLFYGHADFVLLGNTLDRMVRSQLIRVRESDGSGVRYELLPKGRQKIAPLPGADATNGGDE